MPTPFDEFMKGLEKALSGLEGRELSPSLEESIKEQVKKLITEFSNTVFGGIDPKILNEGIVVVRDSNNPDVVAVGISEELMCWLRVEHNKPCNVHLN